jgi:hypothetical protein
MALRLGERDIGVDRRCHEQALRSFSVILTRGGRLSSRAKNGDRDADQARPLADCWEMFAAAGDY